MKKYSRYYQILPYYRQSASTREENFMTERPEGQKYEANEVSPSIFSEGVKFLASAALTMFLILFQKSIKISFLGRKYKEKLISP